MANGRAAAASVRAVILAMLLVLPFPARAQEERMLVPAEIYVELFVAEVGTADEMRRAVRQSLDARPDLAANIAAQALRMRPDLEADILAETGVTKEAALAAVPAGPSLRRPPPSSAEAAPEQAVTEPPPPAAPEQAVAVPPPPVAPEPAEVQPPGPAAPAVAAPSAPSQAAVDEGRPQDPAPSGEGGSGVPPGQDTAAAVATVPAEPASDPVVDMPAFVDRPDEPAPSPAGTPSLDMQDLLAGLPGAGNGDLPPAAYPLPAEPPALPDAVELAVPPGSVPNGEEGRPDVTFGSAGLRTWQSQGLMIMRQPRVVPGRVISITPAAR
ncbi:hypothetical protein [Marinivivus vitaminiproducens]|uniref:hypothetical protein n=1 Tax=Marinivivus vitaminiproducens TaxID=3035935 RepID=UPI00279FFF8A|nr:hypothetical protein P4R82_03280 [Geminicoccaceae bacterium SCSIO 64248]